MSGGSWDYVYHHFEEVADKLGHDKDPLRRALGKKVALLAKAMHAIEWVDSGDYSKGSDVDHIREALGKGWHMDTVQEALAEAERSVMSLQDALASAKGGVRDLERRGL